MNTPTLRNKRSTAISAARSLLRAAGHTDYDLIFRVNANDALQTLDDLLRRDKDLIAAEWYGSASENQIKLFHHEWYKWQHAQQQLDL